MKKVVIAALVLTALSLTACGNAQQAKEPAPATVAETQATTQQESIIGMWKMVDYEYTSDYANSAKSYDTIEAYLVFRDDSSASYTVNEDTMDGTWKQVTPILYKMNLGTDDYDLHLENGKIRLREEGNNEHHFDSIYEKVQ